MMSLTYLDVGGNGLEGIPPALSRCEQLEHLDVSGGHVQVFTDGLSKLTKLRRVLGYGLRVEWEGAGGVGKWVSG